MAIPTFTKGKIVKLIISTENKMANKIIGIFGGGQLGKMSCEAAHKLGFKTAIFCPEKNAIASKIASKNFCANYEDKKSLDAFIKYVDIASLEFENIPTSTIEYVSKKIPTFPKADILKITQNRLLEKNFLRTSGINVTNFKEITSLKELEEGLKLFNNKAILKTATMGYDGKGQYILDKYSDLTKIIAENQKNILILEEFVQFEQEISVIITRNEAKEISCYDPLTNIHRNAILDESIYPANISNNVKVKSQEIASKISKSLDLIGILTIEFFVLPNGDLLVNELAPRPHNSGHFSMDGAITSQFEQFIRAISGLEFGNNQFIKTGKMKNLIGEDVNNTSLYEKNPNAKIHIYGKEEVKKGRKMGHVNILD